MENPASIPEPIRAFIAEHVRSLMTLEALLVVRADPTRRWTGALLARELRSAAEWMDSELHALARRGLLVAEATDPPTFRYEPVRPELEKAVDELAALYAERRYTIIQLIFSGPSSPIQSFADAFRLRKEPTDG